MKIYKDKINQNLNQVDIFLYNKRLNPTVELSKNVLNFQIDKLKSSINIKRSSFRELCKRII